MNQNTVSFTVHNLDQVVYQQIKAEAALLQTSINRVVKLLLSRSLGLSTSMKKADFSHFCGKWSKSDLQEFNQNQLDFSQTRLTDWQ